MIDNVVQGSDYVVISMPAAPDTIGSIGRKQLSLMKPTAFLINVARAEIVDEDALYEALAQRGIAGAALDVWYRYPREAGPTAPATRPCGLPGRRGPYWLANPTGAVFSASPRPRRSGRRAPPGTNSSDTELMQ